MIELITRPVKRLFTFGCSFTGFRYPTWAEILAYDLGNVEFYNYGRRGAGNQYIFNMIMQADQVFKFDNDDLVIVEWTNFAREDRYCNNRWYTPGNIYTQSTYDAEFVKKWADYRGYMLRDMASIKAVSDILRNKKLQYHFLSMSSVRLDNQWCDDELNEPDISGLYSEYLTEILPSFYDVLWDGSMKTCMGTERTKYGKFVNGHPTISEHLTFLAKTFVYDFSESTLGVVGVNNARYETQMMAAVTASTLDPQYFYRDMNFEDLFFTKSDQIITL